MRSCLITETGWTIGEIGKAGMSKIMALFDYWLDFPTLNTIARNYFGYKPKRKPESGDVKQMMRALSPKTGGRAKSLDRAPLYIQKMAADAKKLKKEKPNA